VRDPVEYARAHLKGSLNIGLGGSYATWAGTILDRDKPIVLIAEPGRQEEAAMRLGRIGFDSVVGYLRDGISALESRTDLMTGTTRLTPAEAAAALASARPPLVIDVRAPREWQKGHIEGSVNLPLNHLSERIGEVPADRPLLVHCAGGYRSSIAAGILQRHGRVNLTELNGGISAWEAAGLPVVN
jgi:rhodanese-related sulfurtransferase